MENIIDNNINYISKRLIYNNENTNGIILYEYTYNISKYNDILSNNEYRYIVQNAVDDIKKDYKIKGVYGGYVTSINNPNPINQIVTIQIELHLITTYVNENNITEYDIINNVIVK